MTSRTTIPFRVPESSATDAGKPLNLCVLGAGPGTGNLGVAALGLSLLSGIARRAGEPRITAFDNGRGMRSTTARVAGRELTYRLCGAIPTRRIYDRDSLWRIRMSGRLGGLGHPAIRAIREADAVLDVTSGDSFTDLYSRRRFRIVTAEKLIALEQDRPLILLPQTIGPFNSAAAKRIARRIAKAAAMVWARDANSFAILQDLLGDEFDASRHRLGVDLAFGLESHLPTGPLPAPLASWLRRDATRPVVGFNVSGLIFNRPDSSSRHYGLRADYRRAVIRFLQRVLSDTDANVLLVPHVVTRPGHFEHDPDACDAAADELGALGDGRIAVVREGFGPCETKWLIAQTDWFCGTRMHAAIAALSSGVPTAAIAYSDKTLGVFKTCRQGEHVADPRRQSTDDVVDQLWQSFTDRQAARARLECALPSVFEQVDGQMDDVLARCGVKRMSWQPAPLRKAA